MGVEPGTRAEQAVTMFLDGAAVKAAFDWRAAIEALRVSYARPVDEAMFPPRSMARGTGLWLRTLSGIAPEGDLMGAKLIAANMVQRRASYLISLFDQATTELRALLDGNAITGMRTAATTALALDAMTAPGPVRLGVLGSGFEARNHVRALATIRQIEAVTVYSPNPASRADFAEALADLGLPVHGAETARELVEAAPTMLICAARSRDETPLFDGAWLQPGMSVASIGSTLPEQRELDPLSLGRAARIIADMPDEVLHDTGDLIVALQAGLSLAERIVPLADVVSCRAVARLGAEEILIYKSVGAAQQDLAVAAMCYRRALDLGLATPLPKTIATVQK